MDILSYQWGIREGDFSQKGVVKHERKYIDFIVSGMALSELLQTKERDMITMFGWFFNQEYESRILREFFKQEPAELENGRTIIYGCSECGHIGCGAITAKIVDLGKIIVWQNFGYENDYSEFDLNDFQEIGPFEFEKSQYEKIFDSIKSELIKTPREKD